MKTSSLLLAAALLSCIGCEGRPRTPTEPSSGSNVGWLGGLPSSKGTLMELDLSHGVPESQDGGIVPLPPKRTFFGLVRALEAAQTDDSLKGAFVRLGTTELGWAASEEVGRLLASLRAKGKPVVCHAHDLDNRGTWLTSVGCDRIWLSPAGGVDAVGIAAQVIYLRGALDRLKVRADFVHVGEFKSAAETFTREGPTEQARQALEGTLSSIRRSWIDSVSRVREPLKDPQRTLENGPWSPAQAKERGIIDAVGYESDALRDAQERAETTQTRAEFGPRASAGELDIAEIIRSLAGVDEQSGGRPRLAVMPAAGAIGMSAGGLFEAGGIAHDAMSKTIRRLARDEAVKAVVLRIDSPGGSALASDLLWHELMQLRKRKPIVASVGETAASGGYYLASAANRVLAERTSIVGSIGVFGGKITFDEALAEVGINSVTFTASDGQGAAARAAYMSPLEPWDEATRERVRQQMSSVYELFLSRVAEGRGRPVAEIRKVAEGRIWSGAQGKENGLVDEIGGLSRAIDVARELGGLDASAPITIEGTRESLMEILTGDGEEPPITHGELSGSAAHISERLKELRTQQAALAKLAPGRLGRYFSSLGPLLEGERALAAVPYAITIE